MYSHWMSSCCKPVDSYLLEDFTDDTKQQVFFQCFSLAATVCYLVKESGGRICNIFHGGKKKFTHSLATYLRDFEDKSFGMKSFCLLGINEIINKQCCRMGQKVFSAERGQLSYAHKRQVLHLIREWH